MRASVKLPDVMAEIRLYDPKTDELLYVIGKIFVAHGETLTYEHKSLEIYDN
jgi:hypothetical protein